MTLYDEEYFQRVIQTDSVNVDDQNSKGEGKKGPRQS